MTPAVTLEELLAWNDEASQQWKAHFGMHTTQLDLPCDIGGAATVQAFVRHIWSAELRWAQRIADQPVTDRDAMPTGPLEAIFALHTQAVAIFRSLLGDPVFNWEHSVALDFPRLASNAHDFTRRKLAAHALFHSQRNWAQLATLLRQAGHAAEIRGDLLFSSALR